MSSRLRQMRLASNSRRTFGVYIDSDSDVAGAPGPTGPAGPAGPTGPAGPPGAGWTNLILPENVVVTSATHASLAALAFIPPANSVIEFRAVLMIQTAVTTVGPRPRVFMPSTIATGVAAVRQTSSGTANVFANGNQSAVIMAPVGGLPAINMPYPSIVEGMLVTGSFVSGDVRIGMASETEGTAVTVLAGSFLSYRIVQ